MNKETEKLQQLLKIFADESKYKMILELMKGEQSVCALAKKLDLERTLVSHHLTALRKSELIETRKEGTWIYLSLNKKTFEKVNALYSKILSPENISEKIVSLK